jgi:4-hydroxy-tetrahydrodipicolinate reductase
MKIALLGYGKMGKTIEAIAVSRGHSIVLKVDKENAESFTNEELKSADVAIEFSTPQTAIGNMFRCFAARVPVVVGTTGWTDKMEEVSGKRKESNAVLFHASNFSLGVNLFFRLNKKLAELMHPYPEYQVVLEEIHHIHKLDSPSGTGITIADGILSVYTEKKSWKDYRDTAPQKTEADILPIVSKRTGEVPGTHSVAYTSPIDRITIAHEAFSREGFAFGAVLAAEWVSGKAPGIYGMDDLLGKI